jgi:putative oxidoreductase
MRGFPSIDPAWGITPVRLVLAVIFIASGWQKFAKGIDATSESFTGMGIPAPSLAAPAVAGLELVGGLLLLSGLLTRVVGFLFAIQFAVITFFVKSPAAGLGPIRLDLLIFASALLLLLAGPDARGSTRSGSSAAAAASAPRPRTRGDAPRDPPGCVWIPR